ncbi:MAG TPA: response regulator [Candidatus Limnocylindrales bacterium]|nr:response regulator [Candidatus Limnocylindrales bacterium]
MEETVKRRILIIDDDSQEMRFIEYLLGRPEFELIAASTAATGARLLRTGELPDVLILDLSLADVTGVEFLKQMRGRPQYNSLPVIALADATRPMEIRAALVAGADRYVTRTYMGNNLVKTVWELLETGRAAASTDV